MGTRQNIIDYAETIFKKITLANKYNSDLGLNASEWRVTPQKTMPSITYRDVGMDVIENNNVESYKKLNFEVGIFTTGRGNDTSPEQVRRMIEDVLSVVGIDPSWNGNAYNTEYEGDDLDVDQARKKYGDLIMRFSIYYKTNLWSD